jgi:uncharacterized protein (TIGR02246 family)
MAETSVKSEIARLNAEFDAAFNRGDAAALGALYVEDAVLLPPGAETQKGKAAIEAFWGGMMREYANLHLMTVDLKRYGEHVLREIGKLTVESKAAPGQPIPGKYVVVWEQVAGNWRLATDIANFDSE